VTYLLNQKEGVIIYSIDCDKKPNIHLCNVATTSLFDFEAKRFELSYSIPENVLKAQTLNLNNLEDGTDAQVNDYSPLVDVLKQPKLLGEDSKIITVKSLSDKILKVHMNHQNILFKNRDCQMLTIRDISGQINEKE